MYENVCCDSFKLHCLTLGRESCAWSDPYSMILRWRSNSAFLWETSKTNIEIPRSKRNYASPVRFL